MLQIVFASDSSNDGENPGPWVQNRINERLAGFPDARLVVPPQAWAHPFDTPGGATKYFCAAFVVIEVSALPSDKEAPTDG